MTTAAQQHPLGLLPAGAPLLHQGDLSAQVVESPTEMGERGVRFSGLPGADDAFAGRADQPHRAVSVDAAEAVRVAVRWCGNRVGDIGFAGKALLALMCRSAELGSFADASDLLRGKVGSHRGQQFL